MPNAQWLDSRALADAVTSESNLVFQSTNELVQGQSCPTIRPDSPEKPNGFVLAFLRLPNLVICHLELDSFARNLMDQISAGISDETAHKIWDGGPGVGVKPELWVNKDPVASLESAPLPRWEEAWMKFEYRIRDNSTESLFEGALATALYAVGFVLSIVPHVNAGGTDKIDLEHEEGLPEGARTTIVVNSYERSRRNRMICLAAHGFDCQACGMNFHRQYGDAGRDFIEVHHKVPVASMGGHYVVNPITDLVPLCSNCHRMVHRQEPPYSLEQVRAMISQTNDRA
jgi:5-methylcytosine-specific restriction protein A